MYIKDTNTFHSFSLNGYTEYKNETNYWFMFKYNAHFYILLVFLLINAKLIKWLTLFKQILIKNMTFIHTISYTVFRHGV